jgi:hypothetical protein
LRVKVRIEVYKVRISKYTDKQREVGVKRRIWVRIKMKVRVRVRVRVVRVRVKIRIRVKVKVKMRVWVRVKKSRYRPQCVRKMSLQRIVSSRVCTPKQKI